MSRSQHGQTLTLARAGAAYTVTAPRYYERVIVTNESAGDVYVSTSGSAVADTEGDFGAVVLPSAWRVVGNGQSSEASVSKTVAGREMREPVRVIGNDQPRQHSVSKTVP